MVVKQQCIGGPHAEVFYVSQHSNTRSAHMQTHTRLSLTLLFGATALDSNAAAKSSRKSEGAAGGGGAGGRERAGGGVLALPGAAAAPTAAGGC